MMWHYDCPKCGHPLAVDWEAHGIENVCPHCHRSDYPPTPSEDHAAYIGGDHWPSELESAVIGLRGTTCDIPGCYHQFETLALRRPASQGGRLSVENLVPMCHHHARLKGDQDYDRWVRNLTPEERAGAKSAIEIVFTSDEPEPKPAPPAPKPRPAGTLHFIAGKSQVSDEPRTDSLRLVVARPVPAGLLRRLTLHYSCRLGSHGACRVALAAWPAAAPPDWSKGLENSGAVSASNRHEGDRESCLDGLLELDLPPATGNGLWVVAVFLANSGGHPELADYLLAGRE
ncbi:MAG: hypothetical protein R6X12_09050 [bacterium]